MLSVFYLLSSARPGGELTPSILGSWLHRPRPVWHEPGFRAVMEALFRVHWPVYADLQQYKMSR